MELTPFPSEPWDLHGHALATLGLVPANEVAAPPGTRPVTLAGRALVGTALLSYTEPSPLTYDELLAFVVVRRGLRFFIHIPQIWVDSPASRDGGRALWSIPKELARFEDQCRRATGIAAATVIRARGSLRVPVGFRVAQTRDERTLVTPVRGSARVSSARASWQFDADGPLAVFTRMRPLVHVLVRRFHLTFGPADR